MFNNMTITRAIKSRFDALLSIYTKGKTNVAITCTEMNTTLVFMYNDNYPIIP